MHAQVQAERRERRAAIWQRGEEAAAEARLWQEKRGLRVQLLALQREHLSMAVELQQWYSSSWGSTWLAQQWLASACVRRALTAAGAHEMIAHAAH